MASTQSRFEAEGVGERFTLSVQERPTEEDVQAVRQGLIAHNIAVGRIDESEEVTVLVRNEAAEIVGGAVARMWGEVVEIKFLWLHEALRGQGVGTRLLVKMEAVAQARGCRVALLDTYSFQAPDFYRKHGYEVLGAVEGYPDGIRKLFMQKRW